MKSYNQRALAMAIHLTLATRALAATGSAFAQDSSTKTDQATAKSLETVTVTGSRIPRVDVETAQPVVTISRTQLENQGFTSVCRHHAEPH